MNAAFWQLVRRGERGFCDGRKKNVGGGAGLWLFLCNFAIISKLKTEKTYG